ncbi:MAG: hypothetical protein V4857_09925 [Pseudomonadota bacterium]
MLGQATRPHVETLAGRLPSAGELRELAAEHGLDFATLLLFQAVHASPVHAAFIAAVEGEKISTSHAPLDVKILIIPALFYGLYPETGADGRFAADIARQCGFSVGTIPIKSMGTSTENARIIRDALAHETASQIWIFGISKGNADFRAYLQLYPAEAAAAPLRGWINVCGVVGGSQVADHHTRTRFGALKYRAICRLFGAGYDLLREMRTDHPYWRKPIVLPPQMKVFSFVAIPLGAHIQKTLIKRYRAVSPFGPNDGMVVCRDAILDGGPAYPVWGADHFFRSPEVIPLLYRFFSFLRGQ